MENFDWDDLLADIEEQNAVLLLGHGFLPGAQQALAKHLEEKLGEKLLRAYQREGLYLFADSEAKTIAQKEVSRFYKGFEMDEAVLKKIAEMPFPLIVSANPDKKLAHTFAQYRQPLQFDYFTSHYKTHDYEVGKPNRDKPLLFNLCGSVEDRESLLLDYDDLFQMLKVLLTDIHVPDVLRTMLRKTTTYIFVGFHFERWYTQLFMRYLNMNDNRFSNNSSNYVLKTTFSSEDAQQFFLQQFNVKYIGADASFFDELHQRFSQKYPNQLRQLVDTLSPTATTIVQLIEKADYPAAFQMMKIFANQLEAEDQTLISMTEAEFHQHEQLRADGTSTQEHLGIMLAKVRKNLLHLAKQL